METSSLNVLLVGITIVFFALILLSFTLYLFGKIFGRRKNRKNNDETEKSSDQITIEGVPDKKIIGSSIENINDAELVAVLTSAVQTYMGREIKNSLKVKSFRRVDKASPVWNTTGKIEQISIR